MSDEQTCPHCGDSDVVVVDKHPGVITSDSEKTDIEYHHIYRCNKCRGTSNDCDKDLNKLVYKSIERIIDDAIEKEYCENIENRYVFLLARVLYFLRRKEYKRALQTIGEIEQKNNVLEPPNENLKLHIPIFKKYEEFLHDFLKDAYSVAT